MSIVINRQVVQNILDEIKSKNNLKSQLDKELYIMDNHKELYEAYPFLFKKLTKVIDDKENLNMLFLLIDKMDSINAGKENKTVVETELGQQLADKYLNKDKTD